MLKEKYKFTGEYDELAIMLAHLKAVQARAVIHPHTRPEGKSLELLLCSIIKPFAKRLDAKLYDYSSTVSFFIKKEEALAFHCAYKYKWIPYHLTSQQIFETIDKVI